MASKRKHSLTVPERKKINHYTPGVLFWQWHRRREPFFHLHCCLHAKRRDYPLENQAQLLTTRFDRLHVTNVLSIRNMQLKWAKGMIQWSISIKGAPERRHRSVHATWPPLRRSECPRWRHSLTRSHRGRCCSPPASRPRSAALLARSTHTCLWPE